MTHEQNQVASLREAIRLLLPLCRGPRTAHEVAVLKLAARLSEEPPGHPPTRQKPGPFYYPEVSETSETPVEWRQYFSPAGAGPVEGPLDLASITDLCACSKCTAVLKDEYGTVLGRVDKEGNYTLVVTDERRVAELESVKRRMS
jgi:hypothetical protein